ncbi:hypothetical protein QTP88_015802 [Uroleucon formosanum]
MHHTVHYYESAMEVLNLSALDDSLNRFKLTVKRKRSQIREKYFECIFLKLIIDITIEASLRIHVGITTNNHNEIIDTILVVFGKATGRNEKKFSTLLLKNQPKMGAEKVSMNIVVVGQVQSAKVIKIVAKASPATSQLTQRKTIYFEDFETAQSAAVRSTLSILYSERYSINQKCLL